MNLVTLYMLNLWLNRFSSFSFMAKAIFIDIKGFDTDQKNKYLADFGKNSTNL